MDGMLADTSSGGIMQSSKTATGARLLIAALTTGILLTGSNAAGTEIPAAYQDLYNTLNSKLVQFAGVVSSRWDHSRYPVAFSAGLSSANANAGPGLVDPQHYGVVLQELDAMQALGAKAVTVCVSFPILYQPFFNDPAIYQQYVDFYTKLANDVRARGMKLIVESSALFGEDTSGGWDIASFYKNLTWSDYQNGRMQVARTIAQVMRPDYLSVIGEPDTEAGQTGRTEVNTVEGATSLLTTIVNGVEQAGVTGVSLGAGMGTWQAQYQQFVQSFVKAKIQFLNIHVYPVTGDYLTRMFTMADLAASAGKSIGIGQAWLSKVRANELGSLPSEQGFSRDTYSFWAPLDQTFLQDMVAFSYCQHAAFLSPFWSRYFRAYLDYDGSLESLLPDQVAAMAQGQAGQNMSQGIVTDTGKAYSFWIVSPTDKAAPTSPAAVAADGVSTSTIVVSWTAAADNVGVLGYTIQRNGVVLGTTAGTLFVDRGLAAASTHSYVVQAYDVAGNLSAPSAMAVGMTKRRW
jgi:hypothetical protein